MSNNNWAMLSHALGFVGYFGNGIGSVIAPLILWLAKRGDLPVVDEHAKESLNFNLSVMAIGLVLVASIFLSLGILTLVAAPALIVLGLFHLVATIWATVEASKGNSVRYPFTLRFIK